MARAFVSLGSNVEPERAVRSALLALAARFGPIASSSVYRSRAVGFDGADFLNLVASFDTGEAPAAIVAALKTIEVEHGRERSGPRFGDRTLDLDLLLLGALTGRGPGWELPRAEILEHAHVLWPLAELAGELRHPVRGTPYAALWAAFEGDKTTIRPIPFVLPAEVEAP